MLGSRSFLTSQIPCQLFRRWQLSDWCSQDLRLDFGLLLDLSLYLIVCWLVLLERITYWFRRLLSHRQVFLRFGPSWFASGACTHHHRCYLGQHQPRALQRWRSPPSFKALASSCISNLLIRTLCLQTPSPSFCAFTLSPYK